MQLSSVVTATDTLQAPTRPPGSNRRRRHPSERRRAPAAVQLPVEEPPQALPVAATRTVAEDTPAPVEEGEAGSDPRQTAINPSSGGVCLLLQMVLLLEFKTPAVTSGNANLHLLKLPMLHKSPGAMRRQEPDTCTCRVKQPAASITCPRAAVALGAAEVRRIHADLGLLGPGGTARARLPAEAREPWGCPGGRGQHQPKAPGRARRLR